MTIWGEIQDFLNTVIDEKKKWGKIMIKRGEN